MFGAIATRRIPSEPPTRPITIQGRRMPNREVVRSLSLPNNGFPEHRQQGPDPGDHRSRSDPVWSQRHGKPFDPHGGEPAGRTDDDVSGYARAMEGRGGNPAAW